MKSCQAIILERHPIFRLGLRRALGSLAADCREVGSFDQLMSLPIASEEPGLILFELWEEGFSQPAAPNYLRLRLMRLRFCNARLVAVSESQEEAVIANCMALGASGFIAKSQSAAAIKDAIGCVITGATYTPPGVGLCGSVPPRTDIADCVLRLTVQQMRVLMMLYDGKANCQIASELGISHATAKSHVSKTLRRLGVSDRTNAVVLLERLARTPSNSAIVRRLAQSADRRTRFVL